jgi:hypothetical protein
MWSVPKERICGGKPAAVPCAAQHPYEKEVLNYIEEDADLGGWEWNGDL